MSEVDPRDPSKPLPDGTRRLAVGDRGHAGFYLFPDGTAHLIDGVELELEHEKYWVLSFFGDVIYTFTRCDNAELDAAFEGLVSR